VDAKQRALMEGQEGKQSLGAQRQDDRLVVTMELEAREQAYT
jgi:hypothetical protein